MTNAVIISLATVLITTPLATATGKFVEKAVEELFEDKEMKLLEKDKLKEEIKNLRLDSELKQQELLKNKVISDSVSKFYKTLVGYPKVYQVSVSVENDSKMKLSKERIVSREEFNKHIVINKAR